MFTQDYHWVAACCRIVKQVDKSILTLAGGPHPSGDPVGTIKGLADLDFLLSGESDLTLPRLLALIESGATHSAALSQIPGLFSQDIPKNTPPADCSVEYGIVENLDDLPFPAWDLMPPNRYPKAPHGAFFRQYPVAPLIVSRGCPFECTFCAGARRKHRKRSIENVMGEIDFLNRHYGVKELLIEDENFTMDRRLVNSFCEALLVKDKGYTWSCPSGIRLNYVDFDDLMLMKRAGCHSVSVGIEFGTERIHDITNKRLNLGLIREKVALLARTGIRTTGFFMLGIPGETVAEMRQTMQLALALPLDRIQVNNFMPLPGSQIWKQLEIENKLGQIDYNRYFVHDVAYAAGGIKRSDIKKRQRITYLRFYLRWRILVGILADIRSIGP